MKSQKIPPRKLLFLAVPVLILVLCLIVLAIFGKEDDAHVHTEVIDEAIPATCTEPGLTQGKHCSECGEILVKQEVTEPLDHDYQNRVCTRCGDQQPTQGLDFTLIDDGTAYALTGLGTATDTEILIPAVYKGLPVVAISDLAFFRGLPLEDEITGIRLPDSIRAIGEYAFYGLDKLTSLILSDGLEKIDKDNFQLCDSLQYNRHEGGLYLGSGTNPYYMLVKLEDTAVTAYTVHPDTKMLYANAFSECLEIRNIYLPDGLAYMDYMPTDLPQLQYQEYGNACYLGSKANPYLVLIQAVDATIAECTVHKDTRFVYHAAFFDCQQLRTVQMSEGVRALGEGVFSRCIRLENADFLPSSITVIPAQTFYGCNSLSAVTIPGNIRRIEYGAFYNCFNIKSVTIQPGVEVIGSNAFDKCNNLEALTIADTVTMIGDYAFWQCYALTSIHIPGSVKTVGKQAFEACTKVTECTLEEGLEHIGERAFSGTQPEAIHIPATVTAVGKNAFSDNLKKTAITVAPGNTAYHVTNNCLIETATKTLLYGCNDSVIPADGSVTRIAECAFAHCYTPAELTIPDGITHIGSRAFYGCFGLRQMVIPDSVTYIGPGAFQSCGNLAAVTLPQGITTIEDGLFANCELLTSITIPQGVTHIDADAFNGCTALTHISIPDSILQIHDDAFGFCDGLQWNEHDTGYYLGNQENPYVALMTAKQPVNGVYQLPEGTKYIHFYLGFDFDSSAQILLPDSLASFGGDGLNGVFSTEYAGGYYLGSQTNPYLVLVRPVDWSVTEFTVHPDTKLLYPGAFSGCTQLTSITLPEELAGIGSNAFNHCTALTTIHLPDSVNYIGSSAFQQCYRLTEIQIPNGITRIEENTFQDCQALMDIHIPEGVVQICESAFRNCPYTSITLPGSVAVLEAESFRSYSYTEVIFEGTMAQWDAVIKDEDWDFNSSDYVITCTDGKLDKAGNLLGEE